MHLPRPSRISDLPASERPRERLTRLGPEALSTSELIAVVLGSGSPGCNALELGARLLREADGAAGLGRLPPELLRRQRGVGPVKAAVLLAAVELGRRSATAGIGPRAVVDHPDEAARLLVPRLGGRTTECLCVLLLDARRRLVRVEEVCRGGVDGASARPAEVFRPALLAGVPAILVAHNHPSGDPTPSRQDVAATHTLVRAGRILAVEVVDHLVVAAGSYRSLRAEGLGFGSRRGGPGGGAP